MITEVEKVISIGGEKRDFIIGFVNPHGDVVGTNETLFHDNLLHYIPKGFEIHYNDKKWRYSNIDKMVSWWDSPDNTEKEAVTEFLKHKFNVVPIRNRLYASESINENNNKSFPYKFWLDVNGKIIPIEYSQTHDDYVTHIFPGYSDPYDEALEARWFRGQRTDDTVFLVGLDLNLNRTQLKTIEDLFFDSSIIKEILVIQDSNEKHNKVLFNRENNINESDIQRIHGSIRKISSIKPRKYKQCLSVKPKGFWYSIGNEWSEYCKDMQRIGGMPAGFYRYHGKRHEYVLRLTDESKILKIDSPETLAELNKKFGKPIKKEIVDFAIDWIEVSKIYDGIEFNPYFGKKHMSVMDSTWYDSISLSSGCVWNTNIIQIMPAVCDTKPLMENKLNHYYQAILTDNPVKLIPANNDEDKHVEIVVRLHPETLELAKQLESHGYGGEDEEDGSNDSLYMAANTIAKKYHLARIVFERDELHANTSENGQLTQKQLKFLKDYCIEKGLKLMYSMGRGYKQVDLNENKEVMSEQIKQLITEGVREKALEDFIKTIIQGTEWQGKVFIAGGYVRDEFMGKDPKDLDLLVNSPNGGIEFAKWICKKIGAYRGNDTPIPPEPQMPAETNNNVHGGASPGETEDSQERDNQIYHDWKIKHDAWEKAVTAIEAKSGGSNPVIFPRFGTAKFNLRGVIHNGIDISDMDVEAVMPRKEQYTAGSRKPTVTGGELKDDVERRDFTVNSLLKDLSSGEILDLTGLGKEDIKKGIVRTPLNPDKIFTDDPLRMLRAIRFAVKYNWKLPMFMLRGLKKNAAQLKNISQERIRDELNKMLVTPSPAKAIKLLKVTNLLPFVIPELVPAIKMTQNKHHKHDVFHHTLDVLGKTEPVLVQRLMALFHDIGKTVTRTVEPETQGVHFYGHEMAGESMVDEVMSRLKYPSELINAVKLGVRNHMRLKQAGDTGVKIKDNTLLRFRNDMGEQLENILKVMHADNVAHSEASSMPNQINNIRTRLEKLKEVPNKPKLPISGKDLQTELGLEPGPIYSTIIRVVTDAWYENPGLSKDEALKIARTVAKV